MVNKTFTLHTYCERWGFTVSIDTTKVMIFQEGRTRKGYKFFYNNKNLEIVDSFAYLGTVLSTKWPLQLKCENNCEKNTTILYLYVSVQNSKIAS